MEGFGCREAFGIKRAGREQCGKGFGRVGIGGNESGVS
jgi:hypothetical protein